VCHPAVGTRLADVAVVVALEHRNLGVVLEHRNLGVAEVHLVGEEVEVLEANDHHPLGEPPVQGGRLQGEEVRPRSKNEEV